MRAADAGASIGKVTGATVKFVGTGEKLRRPRCVYPERMFRASSGWGDVLSLIERAEKTVD